MMAAETRLTRVQRTEQAAMKAAHAASERAACFHWFKQHHASVRKGRNARARKAS